MSTNRQRSIAHSKYWNMSYESGVCVWAAAAAARSCAAVVNNVRNSEGRGVRFSSSDWSEWPSSSGCSSAELPSGVWHRAASAAGSVGVSGSDVSSSVGYEQVSLVFLNQILPLAMSLCQYCQRQSILSVPLLIVQRKKRTSPVFLYKCQ